MGSYNSSYGAINEARELEGKLKYNNNPFLAGYRDNWLGMIIYYEKDYDSSRFPMDFGRDGMVEKITLPSDARYNPDKYIKPLDIALAANRKMVHACVYLGDKQVCHAVAEGGGKVKVDSWSSFLSLISTDKIIRYHPIVPFKKPDIIIRHVAKSVEGTSKYFRPGVKNISGSFDVWRDKGGNSNNCENFTNVCVFGLNFSELDDRKSAGGDGIVINAKSNIDETTRKLEILTNDTPYSRINEIKGYINRGNNNRIDTYVDREGIKVDERIEVQPKDWYRLNNNSFSAIGAGVGALTFGFGKFFL